MDSVMRIIAGVVVAGCLWILVAGIREVVRSRAAVTDGPAPTVRSGLSWVAFGLGLATNAVVLAVWKQQVPHVTVAYVLQTGGWLLVVVGGFLRRPAKRDHGSARPDEG
jgi:hypothetical protein